MMTCTPLRILLLLTPILGPTHCALPRDVVKWSGLSLGTRVRRGPSWRYGDQDGGGLGTVVELRPWMGPAADDELEAVGSGHENDAAGDAAAVQKTIAARVWWDETGTVNAYRWTQAPLPSDKAIFEVNARGGATLPTGDAADGSGCISPCDLEVVGWRSLSALEAAVPSSHDVAARVLYTREAGAAAVPAGLLTRVWRAWGGHHWTSSRGWGDAASAGSATTGAAGSAANKPPPISPPCGGGRRQLDRGFTSLTPWEGVACSPEGDALLGLDLSHNNLVGPLGAAAVLELLFLSRSTLVSLSLARNTLSGPIPAAALCACTHLRFLDLSHNALTGPLPPCFGDALRDLEVLFLAGNPDLVGPIPHSWARLQSLQGLHLHSTRVERWEDGTGAVDALEEMLAGVKSLSLPAGGFK